MTMTLNVRINGPLEDFVAAKVGEFGTYENASEYVRDLIRRDHARAEAEAFEALKARRVEIRCDPHNLHSRRVPERLGIPLEGHLRNAWLDPLGNVRDTLVYAATPEDYPGLKDQWQATCDWMPPHPEDEDLSGASRLRVDFGQ